MPADGRVCSPQQGTALTNISKCNAHYCQAQGTTIPARSLTSWTSSISVGEKVKANIFTQIQSALNTELSKRNMSGKSWTSVLVGNKTRTDYITQISNTLTNCRSADIASSSKSDAKGKSNFSFSSISVGKKVTNSILSELRNNTHTLQQTCLCQCDYCTCNCQYCTCHCNYSCTCNCNYSDFNLKYDIIYI